MLAVRLTVTLQVAAGVIVVQVFVWLKAEALVPVSVMLETVSGAVPELVRMSICDAAAVPTLVLKVSAVLLSWSAVAWPVPVSAIVCGELVALSTTVRAAVSVPATDGVKVMERVQLAPAATLVPQVLVWLKLAAFVPLRPMEVMASVAEPVLVSVTVCAGLALATAEAKVSDALLSETAGVPDCVPPPPDELLELHPEKTRRAAEAVARRRRLGALERMKSFLIEFISKLARADYSIREI
jgi:hypothetical protein